MHVSPRPNLESVAARSKSVGSPDWDIKVAQDLMRRGAFVEVDGVYIAFDDVDKANSIGFFFPERAFTQTAGEFQIGLLRKF